MVVPSSHLAAAPKNFSGAELPFDFAEQLQSAPDRTHGGPLFAASPTFSVRESLATQALLSLDWLGLGLGLRFGLGLAHVDSSALLDPFTWPFQFSRRRRDESGTSTVRRTLVDGVPDSTLRMVASLRFAGNDAPRCHVIARMKEYDIHPECQYFLGLNARSHRREGLTISYRSSNDQGAFDACCSSVAPEFELMGFTGSTTSCPAFDRSNAG
jgi:hypothetical protein